jgi:hypothetical protein
MMRDSRHSLLAWFGYLLVVATIIPGCADSNLRGPFFVTTPPKSSVADATYEYDAFAAGYVNSVSYNLVTAPAGMVVGEDGQVTWLPTLADLGTWSIELSVSDGETAVTQSWDLVIHQDLLLGVNYSPIGHLSSISEDDDVEFLAGSDAWGKLIGFYSGWRDSMAESGMIPAFAEFAMDARSDLGTNPAVGFSWSAKDGTADLLSDGDMINNSWSNQESRDEFLDMVTDYASTYSPAYLYLGDDINAWFWTDQAGWSDWLDVLGEAYDAIKGVSPNTIVYTTFQLERLKGLGNATQGWTDPPHWNLVDEVAATGKVDAIGFNSYPYFEYATPQAIPADYFDEIAMHWSGPVIFTETSWAGAASAPFPGGLTEQGDYVDIFFDLTDGLTIEYATWLYLHDLDDQALFPAYTDVGFRSNDGLVVRPADMRWQDAVNLRQRP